MLLSDEIIRQNKRGCWKSPLPPKKYKKPGYILTFPVLKLKTNYNLIRGQNRFIVPSCTTSTTRDYKYPQKQVCCW